MEASGVSELVAPKLALVEIQADDLPHVWASVEPLVQKACRFTDGMLQPQTVIDGLMSGMLAMLCLVEHDTPHSVMVLQKTLQNKAEVIAVSGADVSEWLPFEEKLDAFAAKRGCTAVRIPMARKGWLRKLPHWDIVGYVMERKIDGAA